MHKTKKKTKTAKLPKPIKVKKEKSDEDRLPQPMTHYIDDRLEMVKQIFNTLKPKTIVNLAPDFLKTKALEEIEEACLDELMCISTKRLKSIITATKCPTDTESSDNDSDVERHEEHISLEEISSDSEIEGSSSKKAKKKKNSKNVEGSDTAKKNTSNEEDGQISVLELLELQARARAIRSQLALEPVTKIEVDSDEEKRNENKSKPSKRDDKSNKANKIERKRLSSEGELRDSAKISKRNGSTESLNLKANEKDEQKHTSKKVKLKRTYRCSTNKETEDEEKGIQRTEKVTAIEDKEKSDKEIDKGKSKENKSQEFLMPNIKREKGSRSPSPDVIPIVAEPETLLITDSSDDERKKEAKKDSEKSSSNNKSSNVTHEKETLIQTESTNIGKESRGHEKETEEHKKETVKLAEPAPSSRQNDKGVTNPVAITQHSASGMSATEIQENEIKGSESNISNSDKVKIDGIIKKSNEETSSAHHSDDDQNDDVISLGGDLENEMNEQLENEVNAYSKKTAEELSLDNNKSQDESQQEDVISLESSEEERLNDNQSWHSRYMKSSKVSKVLAASRLGKRVRDKIKKSKHAKKENLHENSESEKEKSTPVFTSKHEDGSIEQYKELLEMRQRKS